MIIDTNAASDWADGTGEAVEIIGLTSRRVITVTTLGEYLYGIKGSYYRTRYEQWLKETLPLCEIHSITSTTAEIYGQLRHDLKKVGKTVPPNDLWIAACAIELSLPILSNDQHFDLIPNVVRIGFKEAE